MSVFTNVTDGYHITFEILRGVIIKIQPLRNTSIFNNIICVPISKVLPEGMSNHPHLVQKISKFKKNFGEFFI